MTILITTLLRAKLEILMWKKKPHQQTRQGKKKSSWEPTIMELFILYLTLKKSVLAVVRARHTSCGCFYMSIINTNYSLPAPWKMPSISPIGAVFCCPGGTKFPTENIFRAVLPFPSQLDLVRLKFPSAHSTETRRRDSSWYLLHLIPLSGSKFV